MRLFDTLVERRRPLELPARAGEVPIDGPGTHAKARGDRLDGSPLCDEEHDSLLDRGQLGYGHGAPLVDVRKMRGPADISLTPP
jgi:hypothetical protein